MPENQRRTWMQMRNEQNVRERMERDSPEVVKVLDYLQSKVEPFDGQGWEVFGWWLRRCYIITNMMDGRPADVPYMNAEFVRCAVFIEAWA